MKTKCCIVNGQGTVIEFKWLDEGEEPPAVYVRSGCIYEHRSGAVNPVGVLVCKYRLTAESTIARIW